MALGERRPAALPIPTAAEQALHGYVPGEVFLAEGTGPPTPATSQQAETARSEPPLEEDPLPGWDRESLFVWADQDQWVIASDTDQEPGAHKLTRQALIDHESKMMASELAEWVGWEETKSFEWIKVESS